MGGGTPEGRPCLVGTTSVMQSEAIVKALAEEGIDAELLNAQPENAAREGEIVAQAGRPGVVTVATNMAGRGTDILLGGCPSTMARLKTRAFLFDEGVLTPEERAFYPPSPADEYYPCDLDDDTMFMLKAAAVELKKEFGDDLTAIKFDELLTVATDTTEGEDDPSYIVKLRDAAQAVKDMFQEKLSPEKEIVKDRGGLYVMGTNRHESARIDGQLRGRAGRQGDPGTSRFFLSFEDDMFVILMVCRTSSKRLGYPRTCPWKLPRSLMRSTRSSVRLRRSIVTFVGRFLISTMSSMLNERYFTNVGRRCCSVIPMPL